MTSQTVCRGRRRSKRWLAPTLVLLIAALPWVAAEWEGHRLTVELARLRAAGEPVTPSDLPAETLPDADNASLDYQAAGKLIDESRPAWRRWDGHERGEFQPPLTPAEREALRAVVADNGPALAHVTAARGRAAGSWHDAFVPPYLTSVAHVDWAPSRRAARLLSVAALSAHAEGDDALAMNRLLDLCRVADAAEHRPALLGHLVADGIWSLAAAWVDVIAPDLRVGVTGGASRSQVDSLIARLLDGSGMAAGQALAWRTERMLVVDNFRDVAGGGGGGITLDGEPPPRSSARGYVLGAMALSDAVLGCDYIGQLMVAGRAVDLPTARRRLPAGLDAQMHEHPYRHLFAGIWLPGTSHVIVTEFRCTADRRLAATALAVRLFASAHGGRLPTALADLVPSDLPFVPSDPLAEGRPLLYRSDCGDPRVYSVGENGDDNAGSERDPRLAISQQSEIDDIVVHLTRRPRPTTGAAPGTPPGMSASPG